MKICVISTPIFRLGVGGLVGYGGLEQIAYQQAVGLAAKGHEVSVVCPDASEVPGCTVIPVGWEKTVDEIAAYGGYPEAKNDKGQTVRRGHGGYWQHLTTVDAIVDHSWLKCCYSLKQEGRIKAPILGVCHAPVNTMFHVPPPVEKPCIVCISEDQRSHYEALFNQKAKVCYNGIDTSFYRPLNIPRTDRFLFVARFSRIKGAALAIEACKKVGVGLDLVGDTTITNEPDYFALCQKMCDGKQIRMVGPASRGNCVWWFSQAYAFLHPVRDFREPFGLAPVEAMACGLPVIAWRNGAISETVNDGTTGSLVQSADELEDAVNGWAGPIADKTREVCREQAERFTVQKMVDRMEQLCEEAISGGW